MSNYINFGKVNSLKRIGIENKDVLIDRRKIIKIKEKHSTINNIIKIIPDILNNPVLILRSRSVRGRIVVFSNKVDKNNNLIMIVLELNPNNDSYMIASVYARDKISNLNNWINNENNILYIKEDEEIFNKLNIKIPDIETKENIMIKDIPLNERPREKAIISGVENLSNEDLISIILKTGTKSSSVKTLSNNILSSVKDINDLKNITLNRLIKINGIGKVKATTLLAALELGKRVYYLKEKEKIKLNNSKKIYEYFKDMFLCETQENFYAIYLDSKSYLISYKLLFKGTLNSSLVHPREVFKYAFLESAYSIIIMHNHPSGDATPSIQDEEITSSLFEIGKLVGISVVDHIIFGNNTYFSFYEYINSKKNNI